MSKPLDRNMIRSSWSAFCAKARDAVLLRKLYPDLYQGYTSRQAHYTSDSGTVKTTVTEIHRFSREDAIVLEGTVQNETSHPIQFDGRATTVQVANEVHPAKLTDCLRPIPAGATVPIVVVIQGDIGGGRANLSIQNEFGSCFRGIPGQSGPSRTVCQAVVSRFRRRYRRATSLSLKQDLP